MRKVLLCAALSLCLLFSGCEASELSSLEEISSPYAGEYFCEKLTLGGRDVLSLFEKVTLTLERDGTFALSYKKKGGGEGGLAGSYTLDGEQNTVSFTIEGEDGETTRVFPYEKGRIFFEVPILGRLLFAEFAPHA